MRRIVREIGALAAVLGGLDLLVFTAGAFASTTPSCASAQRDLAFLGVAIDDAANASDAAMISSGDSRVVVGVEPTNEEWVAARDALWVCRRQ